jgi:DNA mismatch repair protein MutL
MGLAEESTIVGQVQTLPEDVINHIAAGEVIERPASVVKELIENAFDAQARRIDVTIEGGGVSLMQVDDDGHGMDAEDAVQCFQRHATSKLRRLTDLDALRTMGFRGEALPSIAAVSRVHMTSRCPRDVAGTRVVIEGGRLDRVEACGAPPGTSFRIQDLFYNMPARLKFLKRQATESSHVTQHFTALALTALEVQMTLRFNGRLHTQAVRAKTLGDRLDMIFGVGLQENLLDVEWAADDLQINGLTARATFHRATRRQQFFFVNGRPVQSRALSHALYEAYRTLVPRDRHPVAFLFLTLPPGAVDVNVHPAKLEVRFRQERQVYDSLRRLLQQRLRESFSGAAAAPAVADGASVAVSRPVPMMWQAPERSSPGRPPWTAASPLTEVQSSLSTSPPPSLAPRPQPSSEAAAELGLRAGYPAEGRAVLDGRPLGQLHDTYILVQYPEGVFIVDQHAAHERVMYERAIASMQQARAEAQQLLFPVPLDLGGVDPDWLSTCLPRLTDLGFTLEPFGGRTYRLHSVPALLAERDYGAALMDVLEVLRTPAPDETPVDTAEAAPGVPGVLHRLVTVMACHGAIRAHQRLQEEEMRALLQDLAQTPRPFTCPHGRPVLLNVALTDIEKKFLRR